MEAGGQGMRARQEPEVAPQRPGSSGDVSLISNTEQGGQGAGLELGRELGGLHPWPWASGAGAAVGVLGPLSPPLVGLRAKHRPLQIQPLPWCSLA